jgi:hypothetical protein
MGDDEYRTCEVVETDRVGGRKKSSSSQQEEEEEEARGGGGLEVQVNDKKNERATAGGVVYALLIL